MAFADPGPLPEIVTLGQAWRDRRPFVDRARASRRPGSCQASLLSLGASADRLSMYWDVVGDFVGMTRSQLAPDALDEIATLAETVIEDEDSPNGSGWGRMTVDDALAWEIVNTQTAARQSTDRDSPYSGSMATRHGWAIAAAGVSVVDLARSNRLVGYEELALMAALRDIRIPALAVAEVFEPPVGVYLEPVQEVLAFGAGGRWWDRRRRLVGDPPVERSGP